MNRTARLDHVPQIFRTIPFLASRVPDKLIESRHRPSSREMEQMQKAIREGKR